MTRDHSCSKTLERLLRQALHKRASLTVEAPQTNAFRLLDGEGDGTPGLFLEMFGSVGLVSTRGRSLPEFFRQPQGSTIPCQALYWKRLDQDQKTSPKFLWGKPPEEPFTIREGGAVYEVSMRSGYSQGIFLDQRANRALVRKAVRTGQRILNTFSYTGAFSVSAALGGAITTSLDLSKPYLEWGKRNLALNGIEASRHFFCRGDAMEWMERFAQKGRTFHGVILDPPTFSRTPNRTFQVKRDFSKLVKSAAALLEPGGWLLASCNDRGLGHGRFERLLHEGLTEARRSVDKLTHTQMPRDFTGPAYLKSAWVRLSA